MVSGLLSDCFNLMWGTRLHGCNSSSYLISSLSRVERASVLLCEMRLNQMSSKVLLALTFFVASDSLLGQCAFLSSALNRPKHLYVLIPVFGCQESERQGLTFQQGLAIYNMLSRAGDPLSNLHKSHGGLLDENETQGSRMMCPRSHSL